MVDIVSPTCITFYDTSDDVCEIIARMIGPARIIARYIHISVADLSLYEIDWEEISQYYPISIELVNKYGSELDWIMIMERFSKEHRPSPLVLSTVSVEWQQILRESRKYVDTDAIRPIVISDPIFTHELLLNIYADVVNWHVLLRDRVLSPTCIAVNMPHIIADRRSVVFLCAYQELTESFISRWSSHLDWVTISKRSGQHQLSAEFIRTWIRFLNLDLLFKHQKLPDDIIDTYKYSIQDGRTVIPTYQQLSASTIINNYKFYSMTTVFSIQKITIDIIVALHHMNVPILKYIDILSENANALVGVSKTSSIILVQSKLVEKGEDQGALFDSLGLGKVLILDSHHGRIKML